MNWLRYLGYTSSIAEIVAAFQMVISYFRRSASDEIKRDAVVNLARMILNLLVRAVPQTKGLDKYLDVHITENRIEISLDVSEVAESF